jgi:hypothetical protein
MAIDGVAEHDRVDVAHIPGVLSIADVLRHRRAALGHVGSHPEGNSADDGPPIRP